MAIYIDADKLLAEYDRRHEGPPGKAREMIEEFPAADVVEVRHGRWIRTDGIAHGIVSRVCSCSLCKRNAGVSENGFWYLSDYCPHCGAKMDGGGKE